MTDLLVSAGRTATHGLRAILLASVVMLALGTILSPAALAATPTHGLIWSCKSAPQPELDQMAGKALEAKIAIHRTRRVASFSECLFLSKKGTFLLWDIASTKMLTDHAGRSVTAQNEYDFLNRTGRFPRRLQFIGRDHTQFLIAGAWADAQQHDVVGIATFGYYHKVNGRKPAFPKPFERLSTFADFVMNHF